VSIEPAEPPPHVPARHRRGTAMHTTRVPYANSLTERRRRFDELRKRIKPDPTPTARPEETM
jgi:hypothetical protein